ncbi:hypothetical protein ARZXY2_4397 (plasmid) [Arthrobacter sp. ZXY-2]|nr:hypothetical protein ARZXY2_4397 [Arthrobacter sp. ZXY-2]
MRRCCNDLEIAAQVADGKRPRKALTALLPGGQALVWLVVQATGLCGRWSWT